MRMRTTAALCSAILLAWSAGASAQPRHEAAGVRLEKVLGLTAEQASAIDQENASYLAARAPLGEQYQKLEAEMEQAIAAGDRNRLSALLLARWEATAAIRKEAAAHDERVRAILTPGQLQKLEFARAVVRIAAEDPRFLERAGFSSEPAGSERVRHTHSETGGEVVKHTRPHVPGGEAVRHTH